MPLCRLIKTVARICAIRYRSLSLLFILGFVPGAHDTKWCPSACRKRNARCQSPARTRPTRRIDTVDRVVQCIGVPVLRSWLIRRTTHWITRKEASNQRVVHPGPKIEEVALGVVLLAGEAERLC